jgi:uncharacterized protein YggE
MRKYVAFAIVVTGGLFIVTLQLRSVQGAANSTPADISVTADGVVHAQPDTARLWIGVEGFGPTLVPTDREADQRLASVVATLRALGIADQHMRTAGMTVAPQYTTQDGQRQELTGYITRSMLEVETEDIPGVPALIDTAMAAGANRVDRIQFESSVLDQLRSQARDLAWQAARAQADQLALRAGTRLDRVTSVDQPMLDETTTIQPDRVTAYAASPGVTPSSVPSGEIEVRARLRVVWSTQ